MRAFRTKSTLKQPVPRPARAVFTGIDGTTSPGVALFMGARLVTVLTPAQATRLADRIIDLTEGETS